MKRTKDRFGKFEYYNDHNISSLKVFDGEDLEYQDRMKYQTMQQNAWIQPFLPSAHSFRVIRQVYSPDVIPVRGYVRVPLSLMQVIPILRITWKEAGLLMSHCAYTLSIPRFSNAKSRSAEAASEA